MISPCLCWLIMDTKKFEVFREGGGRGEGEVHQRLLLFNFGNFISYLYNMLKSASAAIIVHDTKPDGEEDEDSCSFLLRWFTRKASRSVAS